MKINKKELDLIYQKVCEIPELYDDDELEITAWMVKKHMKSNLSTLQMIYRLNMLVDQKKLIKKEKVQGQSNIYSVVR